jgi:hypothetical protein
LQEESKIWEHEEFATTMGQIPNVRGYTSHKLRFEFSTKLKLDKLRFLDEQCQEGSCFPEAIRIPREMQIHLKMRELVNFIRSGADCLRFLMEFLDVSFTIRQVLVMSYFWACFFSQNLAEYPV